MGFLDKIASGVKGTCFICGKETMHIGKGEFVCNDCINRMNLKGYATYYNDFFQKPLPAGEYAKYAEHRDSILEKYRNTSPMRSIEEYVSEQVSLLVTKNFVVLRGNYDKVVVDNQDVFAISYMSHVGVKELKIKDQLWGIFTAYTNDPYVPAYSFVNFMKENMFANPNKKDLKETIELINSRYTNLKYPICEHKELVKAIKSDGDVKGSIDKKTMLGIMEKARCCISVFDVENRVKIGMLKVEASKEEYDFVRQYGYEPVEYFLD